MSTYTGYNRTRNVESFAYPMAADVDNSGANQEINLAVPGLAPVTRAWGDDPRSAPHVKAGARESEGDGRIKAWYAVCSFLSELDPEWVYRGSTGIEGALSTLYKLKDAAQK